MSDLYSKVSRLSDLLRAVTVEPEVFELRPDYRVMLIAVDGLKAGESDGGSESLLREAESSARQALDLQDVPDVPHVAAWREAYRSFGANPQRTRNSLESLMRRVEPGVPRVNRLTDTYNAISVKHQVPIGGEDLDHYVGVPRLYRAKGTEGFDTTAGGEPMLEHPEPGEVVWIDNAGVTCRRWNWRQGKRTALTLQTRRAIFILDALAPMSSDALNDATIELMQALQQMGPDVKVATRLISFENTVLRGLDRPLGASPHPLLADQNKEESA